MATQHLPLEEPLASEVTAGLIDLAALSREAGYVAFETLDTLATTMLKRVLALCLARRGAVLLSEDLDSLDSDSMPSRANAKTFRALALHNVHEEEAYALLTTLPSLDGQAPSPDMTCWVTYRLMPGEVAREESLQAMLVLGWVSDQGDDCSASIVRCRTILPLLSDAVGAVIGSILLAERVHKLEETAVREALEGMEVLKAELLGTVSHELRSPLASIKGYAATLLRHERRLAREERHQFLLAISEASDRLEVIIERLLEISQLETSQVTIEPSPVDVAYLAGEAITAIEERVTATSPGRYIFSLMMENIDGSVTHTVPLIMADARRLREVFDNLLENAIKYSPEGGLIKIIIRPVMQVQSNEHIPRKMLEICVTDSGMGIPDEHLKRIFDRFHRVDTRLTREVNGLGLGLAICKRIVDLHDGVIWAENKSHGRGSAFYMRLPMSAIPII